MTPNNMTPKQVYLESARRIADGEYSGENWSCCIIGYVEGLGHNSVESPLAQRYGRVFHPEGSSYDFSHEVCKVTDRGGKRDNLRVLMLSLMAVCWRNFQ